MDAPPKYDPRYLDGIAAFNRGEFFDAHEIWEHLWRDCPSADRRFYQSLIQAAVAIYHASRGNHAGAARLARSGREKMDGYPSEYFGLEIEAFWRVVDATVRDRLNNVEHATRPRIELHPAHAEKA